VIVWAISFSLITLGAAALILGYLAPAEKAEVASDAFRYGSWSFGAGLAVAIGYWGVRRYMLNFD